MTSDAQQEEKDFEAQVLRIARALFAPEESFQGSGYLAGRERDGIFVTNQAVVVVECTVSGRKDKAEKDGKKLQDALATLVKDNPYKSVQGYFVTRSEPSADQRSVIKSLKAPVAACSFAQFHSMLIDASEYLTARNKYQFGSATEPGSDRYDKLDEYVGLEFTETNTTRLWSVAELVDAMERGRRLALVGDYGAGKSMTFREVHMRLAKQYRKASTSRFPVTLNLRHHQGQTDPSEALERHARRIGFGQPSKLVRAWLAGDVHVLLDGFDEIATPGWLGRTTGMRNIRRKSTELIRSFQDATPPDVGLAVCGRSHFFDSPVEMQAALGLPSNAAILSTSDFTDAQISQFLQQRGTTDTTVPAWLPSRPLLLGYLAAAGMLEDAGSVASDTTPAAGWDLLLDKVCAREAKMEFGIDGSTVRNILERLATIARGTDDGVGPLDAASLRTAFTEVCLYEPDEGSYQLLQRLPGLGVQDPADGTRRFIDAALVDAARSVGPKGPLGRSRREAACRW